MLHFYFYFDHTISCEARAMHICLKRYTGECDYDHKRTQIKMYKHILTILKNIYMCIKSKEHWQLTGVEHQKQSNS